MNGQAALVLGRLGALGIAYELHEHEPVPTAAARFPMELSFGATICKNLLVATRSESRFFLLMIPVEKDADLKALREHMGCTRLGFAGERALERLLGQRQGNVGVCGVIRDDDRLVEVVFDTSLRGKSRVATHPGDNAVTIILDFDDLLRYVESWGSTVHFFDF